MVISVFIFTIHSCRLAKCNMTIHYLKMSYFSPVISTSVALSDTKLSRFIPLYILKVFTEAFVHISISA